MLFDISEIKLMRRSVGLTQAELAKKSGVSQSLIAKIEAAKIDPAYSKVSKIFSFLDSLRKKQELKAADVMKHSIISIKPEAKITDAIEKMKKHNISQIPVMSNGKCVGVVSEATILASILDKKAKKVGEIMDECPPIISKTSSINIVSELLRYTPLLMVAEKGKLLGIITKSDIIGKLKNV
jgi:predicted transcriptional regulator